MRILLDTSVLLAAMVGAHPMHQVALPCLRRVKDGTDRGFVSAHSLAELCAILTRLPVRPRIPPVVARRLIEENVISSCEVVSLSDKDYAAVIDHLAESGIVGGVTYDVLILYAAIKVGTDRVITLNESDFKRIYPQLADQITSPRPLPGN